MNRALKSLAVFSMVAIIFATGCNDTKGKIAMLEESNQSLLNDLQNARAELARCREGIGMCDRDLTLARGELERLRAAPAVTVPDGWTAVPGGAMIAIEGSVLFDSGKVKLKSNAERTLGSIYDVLGSEYADKDVLVYGHTDDDPIKKSGWQDNYQLSSERSLAVVRWLKERGVDPGRLVACGVGEHRPRVPNNSSSNKAKNRRVEIFALDAEVQTARGN
jgi:chemotaxis protein MotB